MYSSSSVCLVLVYCFVSSDGMEAARTARMEDAPKEATRGERADAETKNWDERKGMVVRGGRGQREAKR